MSTRRTLRQTGEKKDKKVVFFIALLLIAAISKAQINASATDGCSPTVVNFSVNSPDAVSWEWNFGDGTTSNFAAPAKVYTEKGSYCVRVITKNQTGQSTSFLLKDSIRISDIPDLSGVLSSSIVCENDSSFHFLNSTDQDVACSWDFGDGEVSNQRNPVHPYKKAGLYEVRLLGVSSKGCKTNKIIGEVTVMKATPAEFTWISEKSHCDSSYTFELSATAKGSMEYHWSVGKYLSDQKNFKKAFNEYGVFDVKLLITDENGCKDSTVQKQAITISKSEPTLAISTYNQCKEKAVSIALKGADFQSIDWFFSDSTVSKGAKVEKVFSTPGTYGFEVKATTVEGCSVQLTNKTPIQVFEKPEVNFQLNDSVFCAGSPIEISNSSKNVSVYEWYLGATQNSSAFEPSCSFSEKGNKVITLRGITGSCSSQISKVVQIKKPKSDFSNLGLAQCAPIKIHFDNHSTEASMYNWSFGNGDSSEAKHPTVEFNAPGIYQTQLIVFDDFGCSDTTVKDSSLMIDNNAPQNVEMSTFTGCSPYTISFENLSMGYNHWNWEFGDGSFSSIAHPEHKYQTPGEYIISLRTTDELGCAYSIDSFAIVKVEKVSLDSASAYFNNCEDQTIGGNAKCDDCANFKWLLDDSLISINPTFIGQLKSDEPKKLALIVSSNIGCGATKTFAIEPKACQAKIIGNTLGEAKVEILLDSATKLPFSGISELTGCRPMSVDFSFPIDNIDSITWDLGDGNFETQKTFSHRYDSVGTFSVKMRYHIGNESKTLVLDDFIRISGHTNQLSTKVLNSCNALELEISSINTTLSNYIWFFDNQMIQSGAKTLDTIIQRPANVHLTTLTTNDKNGCSFSSSQAILSSKTYPLFHYEKNICLSDTLHIKHNLPSHYQLNWDLGNGEYSTNKNVDYKYEENGLYNLYVTAKDTSGCSRQFSVGSVEINSPNSQFELADKNPICLGDTIELLMKGNATGDQISWETNQQRIVNLGARFALLAEKEGKLEIGLKVTSKDGCASEFNYPNKLLIHAPKAEFDFKKSSSCFPIEVEFNNQSINTNHYEWDFGNGSKSKNKHPKHTFEKKPDAPVMLIASDNYGCESEKIIPVIDLIKAKVKLSNEHVCVPDTVHFEDLSENTIAWNWSFGDGSQANKRKVSHQYKTPGIYSIQLSTISKDGCKDTTIFDSIINAHMVKAAFNFKMEKGCAPKTVEFNNLSNGGKEWNWNFGNGKSSTAQSPTQNFYSGGKHPVSLVVSDEFGCSDSTGSQELLIDGPVARFSSKQDKLCSSDTLKLINETKMASSYLWVFDDGFSDTSFTASHSLSTLGEQTIILLATDSNGCESFYIDNSSVTVFEKPDPNYQLSDTAGCAPLNLKAISIDNSHKHQWFINDSIVGTEYTFDGVLAADAKQLKHTITTEHNCISTMTSPLYIRKVSIDSLPDFCSNEPPITLHTDYKDGHWFIDKIQLDSNQLNLAPLKQGIHEVSYHTTGYCSTIKKSTFRVDSFVQAELDSQLILCSNTPVLELNKNYRNYDVFYTGELITNPFLGEVNINRKNTGESIVTMRLSNGSCYSSDTGIIKIKEAPSANFAIASEKICQNDSLTINYPTYNENIFYRWTCSTKDDTSYYRGNNPKIKLADGIWNIKLSANDGMCKNEFELSNITVLDSTPPSIPTIIRSTIIDNKLVLTEWKFSLEESDKIAGFQIHRSTNNKDFETIGEGNKNDRFFFDEDVKVDSKNYFYRVSTINHCTSAKQLSNPSSNIVLKKIKTTDNRSLLKWTPYYKWEDGVNHYKIQKQDKNGNWITIDEVSGDEEEYLIEE